MGRVGVPAVANETKRLITSRPCKAVPFAIGETRGEMSDSYASSWKQHPINRLLSLFSTVPVRMGLVRQPADEPFRITFALDLFRSNKDRQLSHDVLTDLLAVLTKINLRYLVAHPETPPIYQSGVRYMEEPPGQEDWQDIATTLRVGYGDCLPLSTLVLKEDYSFAAMGDLEVGDRIMSREGFTTVLASEITGEKSIIAFGLDNGCILRCSPSHRVFLTNGEEIKARDVQVGDDLVGPSDEFACGEDFEIDNRISPRDFAWLVGTYIADGWSEKSRFSISGDDANPKRRKAEQKVRAQEICRNAGIHTAWQKKAIAVNDRLLGEYMKSCGTHAPIKFIPNMKWSRAQIEQLLLGLQTDCSTSNTGTLTHGTTSPKLALQLRVLYRMLGKSVHIRKWEASEHKGLGQNAMYRVTVRRTLNELIAEDKGKTANWESRSERQRTSTRVRTIAIQPEELCGDIKTDTGNFYLPESDVIVHNCEDLATWRAAELQRQGIDAVAFWKEQILEDGQTLYHILVRWPNGTIEDPSRLLGMR